MTEDKMDQQVNGLIFKELIKRGYSLDGKTRIWDVADSKLLYLKPDQAQGYLDLLDSVYVGGNIPKEDRLINENMKEITELMGEEPLNLVDLGCGDGRKAVQIIKEASKKIEIRYCPVDISAYMVRKAIDNIKSMKEVKEVIEFQWNISDFDNLENISALLRQGKFRRNFFLLLGNTLTNFEFHDLLYQIRNSMNTGDRILIGNSLRSDTAETSLKKYLENKSFNEFLIKVPENLGFKREELEVNVRFRSQRIEYYYTIKKDRTIKISNKEIRFFEGDQIIIWVVYLYTLAEYKSFLNLYFDFVEVKSNGDNSYALALCKK